MFVVSKKVLGGQSLTRILMNQGFRRYVISGLVVDVGGGRSPDYFDYFQKRDVARIESVDASISGVDFEKDMLSYQSTSIDTVVCANVLEHVYNHRFLVGEMHRILKPGGMLVGFVPFLIQYHPDPHDYFRYTKEALMRIFSDAGFRDIRIERVGGGPFAVNFNNLMLSVPRVVAFLFFFVYWPLDKLFLALRPAAHERYPLGFIFSMRK